MNTVEASDAHRGPAFVDPLSSVGAFGRWAVVVVSNSGSGCGDWSEHAHLAGDLGLGPIELLVLATAVEELVGELYPPELLDALDTVGDWYHFAVVKASHRSHAPNAGS